MLESSSTCPQRTRLPINANARLMTTCRSFSGPFLSNLHVSMLLSKAVFTSFKIHYLSGNHLRLTHKCPQHHLQPFHVIHCSTQTPQSSNFRQWSNTQFSPKCNPNRTLSHKEINITSILYLQPHAGGNIINRLNRTRSSIPNFLSNTI